MQPGILLVNLGTPEAPTRPAVRRYLREFLTDPRVLDIAAPLRIFLGGFLIPLVRSGGSSEAYRSIWTERGSPLLFHSQDLAAGLAERMPQVRVELAMRYGEPSIARAFAALSDCDPVVVVPLYPQYAESSTGTAIEEVRRVAARAGRESALVQVPPFYDRPEYLDALAALARPYLEAEPTDRVLFSYHGLPERHVRASDPTGAHCLERPDCCEQKVAANERCYRMHCMATTRELVARLGLGPDQFSTSFQSRLGRDPWLLPATDQVVEELAADGVGRLVVICPSFVADCLETAEEIGIEARESFVAGGGGELVLVPCLNSEPNWIAALESIVRASAPAL